MSVSLCLCQAATGVVGLCLYLLSPYVRVSIPKAWELRIEKSAEKRGPEAFKQK